MATTSRPPNASGNFPDFTDGDVRIVLSGSRQYQLHSTVLKNISPVLSEQLHQNYAAKLCSKAIKRNVTTRF